MFLLSLLQLALTSLAKYRELAADIENDTAFRGHPKVEAFLRESDKRVPEFEAKYRDTLLKREYDEAVRLANGLLTQADSMFDHSRFDEALVELNRYRESIQAMQEREEYGALGGDRDLYVKEATEVKIPAWQDKYKEKVLGRRGDEIARELRSMAGTAKDHQSHYRDELFLEALQVLKARAKEVAEVEGDAGSDSQLLLSLPQVKDVLQETFQAMYELTQAYDARVLEKRIDEAKKAAEGPLAEANDMLNHSRFEVRNRDTRAREAHAGGKVAHSLLSTCCLPVCAGLFRSPSPSSPLLVTALRTSRPVAFRPRW